MTSIFHYTIFLLIHTEQCSATVFFFQDGGRISTFWLFHKSEFPGHTKCGSIIYKQADQEKTQPQCITSGSAQSLGSLSTRVQSLLHKLSTKRSKPPQQMPTVSTAQCRCGITTHQCIHSSHCSSIHVRSDSCYSRHGNASQDEETKSMQAVLTRPHTSMPHDDLSQRFKLGGTTRISSAQRSSITSDYITDVEMD